MYLNFLIQPITHYSLVDYKFKAKLGRGFEPIWTNKIRVFLKNALDIPKMFEPLWNLKCI